MIAYNITSTNKVWMIDESEGQTIPQWCYTKEGYFVVETLPADVQALVDEGTFETAKSEAIARISKGFEDSLNNGTFLSTQLGIEVDNRRSGRHNDKDNLQTLINLGSYPIEWIGTTAIGTLADSTEALALRTEMELDGIDKYQHKWTKEQEVLASTTVDELNLIVW